MTYATACVLFALAAPDASHSPTPVELLHGSIRSAGSHSANVKAFGEMGETGTILQDGAFCYSGWTVADSGRAAAGAHAHETSLNEMHHCGRPPEPWPGESAAKPASQSFADLRCCGLGGLLAFDHVASPREPDTGPECAAVDERASGAERAAIAERAGANGRAAVADAERAVNGCAAVAQGVSIAKRAATTERSLIVGCAGGATERATDAECARDTTASADAAGRVATGHKRATGNDPEEIVGGVAGVATNTRQIIDEIGVGMLLWLLVALVAALAKAVYLRLSSAKTADDRYAQLRRAVNIAELERAATIAEIERERDTNAAERAIWTNDRESAARAEREAKSATTAAAQRISRAERAERAASAACAAAVERAERAERAASAAVTAENGERPTPLMSMLGGGALACSEVYTIAQVRARELERSFERCSLEGVESVHELELHPPSEHTEAQKRKLELYYKYDRFEDEVRELELHPPSEYTDGQVQMLALHYGYNRFSWNGSIEGGAHGCLPPDDDDESDCEEIAGLASAMHAALFCEVAAERVTTAERERDAAAERAERAERAAAVAERAATAERERAAELAAAERAAAHAAAERAAELAAIERAKRAAEERGRADHAAVPEHIAVVERIERAAADVSRLTFGFPAVNQAAQAGITAEFAVDADHAASVTWMDGEDPAGLPPMPTEWVTHRRAAERAECAAAERCASTHRGRRGGRRGARQRRCILRHPATRLRLRAACVAAGSNNDLTSRASRGGARPSPEPQPQANSQTHHADTGGGCFAPWATVLVRRTGGVLASTPLSEVSAGATVRVADGWARVRCVVRVARPRERQLVALRDGPVLTPGHPVRVNGLWARPDSLGPDLLAATCVPHDGYVLTLVLERGHVLMVDGVECVTWGHGLKDDGVDHPFFGSGRAVQSALAALHVHWRGYVEVHGCVRDERNKVVGLLGAAPKPLDEVASPTYSLSEWSDAEWSPRETPSPIYSPESPNEETFTEVYDADIESPNEEATQPRANSQAYYASAGSGCFAPWATVQVKLRGGDIVNKPLSLPEWNDADIVSKPLWAVRAGAMVRVASGQSWSASGWATVRCVVRVTRPRERLLVALPGGPVLTPGHPVRIAGSWVRPDSLAAPSVSHNGFVLTLVLDHCHVLLVDNVECVTWGHGHTSIALDHPFFGSGRAVRSLSTLHGWMDGYVEVHGCVRDGRKKVVGLLGAGALPPPPPPPPPPPSTEWSDGELSPTYSPESPSEPDDEISPSTEGPMPRTTTLFDAALAEVVVRLVEHPGGPGPEGAAGEALRSILGELSERRAAIIAWGKALNRLEALDAAAASGWPSEEPAETDLNSTYDYQAPAAMTIVPSDTSDQGLARGLVTTNDDQILAIADRVRSALLPYLAEDKTVKTESSTPLEDWPGFQVSHHAPGGRYPAAATAGAAAEAALEDFVPLGYPATAARVQLATSLPLFIQELVLHVDRHVSTADWHWKLATLLSKDWAGCHPPGRREAYATTAAAILQKWLADMSDTEPMLSSCKWVDQRKYELRGLIHTAHNDPGDCRRITTAAGGDPELLDFITHTWWTRAKHGVYASLTQEERRLTLEFVYLLNEQHRLTHWRNGGGRHVGGYPTVLSEFRDTVDHGPAIGGRGGYGGWDLRHKSGELKGAAAEALRRLLRELSHRGQTWAGYHQQTHIQGGESVRRDSCLMSDPEMELRMKRARNGESTARLDEENWIAAGKFSEGRKCHAGDPRKRSRE